MRSVSRFTLTLLFFSSVMSISVADDWPQWRGPQRNGVADSDQSPPLHWSDTRNVKWKTAIPGRGHGSPIVVGDAVYLAIAEPDNETRSMMCLDRESGNKRWTTIVHKGNPTPHKNEKATDASSTPACDGEQLFINFLHDGAMFTSALSITGKILWQTRVADYTVHQGYGASPLIFESLVVVTADNKQGGAIAGLDRQTGDVVWRVERPKKPNYPSPVIYDVAGRKQLLMTGCDLVTSLDPRTGETLWQIDGSTTECVTTTVVCGDLMFTSGGYPDNHVSAVRCDGTGEVVWRSTTRIYVPSMIVHKGHLFAVADAGAALCWNCDNGEERWKSRLGGTFTSSPVLVGDRIYATNESGETFVLKADPDSFELLAKNQLGDECFSSPAIVDSQIFMRIASEVEGQRQESLVCIEAK